MAALVQGSCLTSEQLAEASFPPRPQETKDLPSVFSDVRAEDAPDSKGVDGHDEQW